MELVQRKTNEKITADKRTLKPSSLYSGLMPLPKC